MKKLLVIFLFIFLAGVTISARADQTVIGKGSAEWFNSFSKSFIQTQYVLRYDGKEKRTWLYFNDGGLTNQICVIINDEHRLKLMGYLDKYQEWRKKAIKEGVKLEKEIGRFSSWCQWEINNDWQGGPLNVNAADVTASFFSQNKKVHQFLLEFPSYGYPVSEHPETLYFSSAQAQTLAKQLLDENIQKSLAKATKSKKVEEEFK